MMLVVGAEFFLRRGGAAAADHPLFYLHGIYYYQLTHPLFSRGGRIIQLSQDMQHSSPLIRSGNLLELTLQCLKGKGHFH